MDSYVLQCFEWQNLNSGVPYRSVTILACYTEMVTMLTIVHDFTGDYCQFTKNICAAAPVLDPPVCHNGGSCISFDNNTFACNCQPGYEGKC